MTKELNKWHSRLELELGTTDGLVDRLHETLVEMKNSGINKDQAYEVLASLRKLCRTEEVEDTLLELMDVVSGYCRPENRIWD